MSSSEDTNTEETLSIEPSPFSSRLGTNYAATDEEVKQIEAIIKDPIIKLKELEEEENLIMKNLEAIQEKQQVVLTFVNEHRALLSPIRRLPPDILGEIFYQCLDAHTYPIMRASTAPILLTRVCSGWRDLAFNIPRLWAAIHIPVPGAPYPGSLSIPSEDEFEPMAFDFTDKRVRGVGEWLGRSGGCELDISVSEWVYSIETGSVFGPRIINAILPYSQRLKKISLIGPVATVPELLDLPSSSFTSLRTLSVDAAREKFAETDSEKLRTSGIIRAPNLQEVALIDVQDATKYLLKWGQLTHLAIERQMWNSDHISISSLLDALRSCQALVSLRLRLGGPVDYTVSDPPGASICLPLLEKLAIFEPFSYSSPIFDFIDPPTLKDVEYNPRSPWNPSLPPEDPGTPSSFLMFLSRTTANIHHLTINPESFSERELVPCLRECSRLKSLTLIGWGADSAKALINDEFLSLFYTALHPNTYLCPDLEVLVCRESAEFSDDALYRFIERKQDGALPGVAKLRRLVVWFPRSSPENLEAKLPPFVEEGLFMEILYRPTPPSKIFSASDGLKKRDLWNDYDDAHSSYNY